MASFFENAFSSISDTLQQTAEQHGTTEGDAANNAVTATKGNAFANFGNIGSMVGAFRSGKPVELGRFSEAGFSGRIVAIADGSDAAKHLDGVATEAPSAVAAASTPTPAS